MVDELTTQKSMEELINTNEEGNHKKLEITDLRLFPYPLMT